MSTKQELAQTIVCRYLKVSAFDEGVDIRGLLQNLDQQATMETFLNVRISKWLRGNQPGWNWLSAWAQELALFSTWMRAATLSRSAHGNPAQAAWNQLAGESGRQGGADSLQPCTQVGLVRSLPASRAGDHHAFPHIEFQRHEQVPGVVDIGLEQPWIGVPLDESQDQGLSCMFLLKRGGKAGREEGVETVEEDLGLGAHLAHEDGRAEHEGLGLQDRGVHRGHIVLDDAATVLRPAGEAGPARLKVKVSGAPVACWHALIPGSFQDGFNHPGRAALRTRACGKSNDVYGGLSHHGAPIIAITRRA
ncbi:hypothetical protein Q9293_13840 [Geothrix sp. PMB-07]|nr:hypothetical protein [Geothrix sp. PMB-07]WLT30798.1 hypothetical protein Q9293_13840 [Geothrix sp. PMB-07]